jgi:uncharacterized surface protein with fasciclin (FAS1) repeats
MRKLPTRLAIAVMGLSLVAAACGDDADTTTADPATTTTVSGTETEATEGSEDIVDTAVAAGSFTTLAAALDAAGLVDTLKGPGPFTVFAPTDAAFDALPAGTVEDLLKPENRERLREVLTYHVVADRVPAADVVELDEATTVEGSTISIDVRNSEVFLNDTVKVTATDIEASNGIIHVIDAVLLPS